MECKYCDAFTGVCINPECPMRGDCCPVPDTEGLCRYEDREEVAYKLTPKGCATAALMNAGLIKNSDDPAVDVFFAEFSKLMVKCGYVEEKGDG